MEERRGAYRILVGRPEERSHLEVLGVDGIILLKSILQEWGAGTWSGLIWLRIGTSGRLLRT
jgi:hypothetical protein